MSESPLQRVAPGAISATKKEGVLDALLNLTANRAMGRGPESEYIYAAMPRTHLISGHLLPKKDEQEEDEVTSPIWTRTIGMKFDINQGAEDKKITLQPKISVYVRVLPTKEDFQRPDCALRYRLRDDLRRAINATRRSLRDRLKEELGQNGNKPWDHPDWAARSDALWGLAYDHHGVPANIAELIREQNERSEQGEPTEEEADEADNDATAVEDDSGNSVSAEAVRDAKVTLDLSLFEPLQVPLKFMRLHFELPGCELDLSRPETETLDALAAYSFQLNNHIREQLVRWANDPDPDRGGLLWAYRHTNALGVDRFQDWDNCLAVLRAASPEECLPPIELHWDWQCFDNWTDPARQAHRLSLENRSVFSQPEKRYDNTVFDTSFTLTMPRSLHAPLKLDRIKPSYRYNAFMRYPAMGVNCGITATRTDETLTLRTNWAPRYVQPRIEPIIPDGVTCVIKELAEPAGLESLSALIPAFDAWIAHTEISIDPTADVDPGNEKQRHVETGRFQRDLEAWRKERDAIKAGLDILLESRSHWTKRGPQEDERAVPFEAWLATNEAMAAFLAVKLQTDRASWRLFQVAFMLATIPSLATRIKAFSGHYNEERDDTATLLYFATGGGKSEAFFGLLVYNLMLDRLRGKELGVTAMIRYPLRLLTVQQAQRAAKVLAFAEQTRKERKYPGRPFSIGFWVGSSGSPNRHDDSVKDVPKLTEVSLDPDHEDRCYQENAEYQVARDAWRKLSNCPLCGKETALRRTTGQYTELLGHYCTNASCKTRCGGDEPLPFYIVDTDIYALAPSVLLGTVDKLALIGHSPRTIQRILGMLGAAPWYHEASGRLRVPESGERGDEPSEHGCVGLQPAYPNGRTPVFHDPFPSLLIQDEAHLLEESLGTFAGIFETLFDTITESLSSALKGMVVRDPRLTRRRAKVIAASATVENPQNQLEHLYQRPVPAMQFPAPGPSLYESFYYRPRISQSTDPARNSHDNPEVSSETARVYAALMTNGGAHTTVSMKLLAHYNLVITSLYERLRTGDEEGREVARSELLGALSEGVFHEGHHAALASIPFAELLTLVDLHRVALTYVTNKKGGDQLMDSQLRQSLKIHEEEGLPLEDLRTELVTGAVDIGAIQRVIEDAQAPVEPGDEFLSISRTLRSVVATSAISHGVDVDEFNAMFFAGMPSDTAEYIQASSRVGRTHVGFVSLIPTPQRRRDRHIVNTFDIHHRFLERMIAAPAIDRYADQAIARTFPSLFMAYIGGVRPMELFLKIRDKAKLRQESITYCGEAYRIYEDQGERFMKPIRDFMEKAIGLSGPSVPKEPIHYQQMIKTWLSHMFEDEWTSSGVQGRSIEDFLKNNDRMMMRPMTSLRDVDEPGRIVPSPTRARGRARKKSELDALMAKVMKLVRGGRAEPSELVTEGEGKGE